MEAYKNLNSDLVDFILAIKSDHKMKALILDILEVGSYSQQVRVDKLIAVVKEQEPPERFLRVLTLLKDAKIANLIYSELKKDT